MIEQVMNAFTEFTDTITASPEFQAFGIMILFLFTIIPSIKTVVPELLSLPLLVSGMSPALLILVSATGATIGDYVLYILGRGSFRLYKGEHKKVAQADHLLHKYRLPIFLATPFLSIVGDIIVFTAGLERIGFKKIIPFIFTGQILRMAVGMLALMGLIQLPVFFGS